MIDTGRGQHSPAPEGRGQPRTMIYIRSCGGENLKGRPAFYDKTMCLASLVRAASEAGATTHLWFVNDGPIPEERERLMRAAGRVVPIRAGSNRGSYRATLAMAAAAARPGDLVYLGEDDYLYRPEAFLQLQEAAATVPQASYFSLYAGELAARPADTLRCDAPGPVAWRRAVSTTSSFAVRGRELREDVGLLRLLPFTGGAFDHTTCLTLAGHYPFQAGELRADLLPLSRPPAEWPRSVARGSCRTVLGMRALRRPTRRRSLVAPDRDLATHLEEGGYDPRDPWADLADQTRQWWATADPLRPGTQASSGHLTP